MQPTIRELITIVEDAQRTPRKGVRFQSLPEDMQCLIEQFVEDDAGDDFDFDMIPRTLPLVQVSVTAIQDVELDDHGVKYNDEDMARYKAGEDFPCDRGQLHAMCMDLKKTPPVIVANGWLLDGRHRLFQAKRTGVATLPAIDLTGLVSADRRGMAQVSTEVAVKEADEELDEKAQTITSATTGRMINRKKAERITDPKACFHPKAP